MIRRGTVFLLDTNVVSELRPGKPGQSAEVRAWAAKQPVSRLFISSITVLELELGVLRLERRTPPEGGTLRAWLTQLRDGFQDRILPFSARTAELCAGLHVPDRKSERDAMIGATALEHGFALVTRNVRDFSAMALQLVNPWEPQ